MLSVDDAKLLAATWRTRFKDEADFETSWSRYMDSATVPDAGRLEVWLAKDLDKSAVKHVGVPLEPLVPTLSRYDLNGCYHCYGRGWVRLDVTPPVPPKPCPACHGRDGDLSAHCTSCARFSSNATTPERLQCYKCGHFEDEPADERCSNPKWHDPNWTTGDYPHERPVPGWKTVLP